jgi:hypothetical protein
MIFGTLALIIILIFGTLIIPASLWMNVSIYAQQDLNKGANGTSSVVLPSSSPTKKLHPVKITSPTKGQQIPVGSNLTVLGSSIDNASSSCDVSVTLNGVKPYQKTVPVAGANDYSKWNFTLSPKYASIKDGENQLKAKFSCADNPALLGHFSRNFTGIVVSSSKPASATASNTTS